MGVSVIVTDDLFIYKLVAQHLNLKHQIWQFHERRWLVRALKELQNAFPQEWLLVLEEIKELISELPLDGAKRLYALWKQVAVRRGKVIHRLTPIEQLRDLLIRLSKTWPSHCAFYTDPAIPWMNNGTEIIFTQMTKSDLFTSWTGRDRVSDFDIFVLDDHSINKQFYQLPLLFKTGILQTCLNTTAKSLDGCSQA
jgi:hypothetical protein